MSPISMHPLTYLEDGDDVIVGRRDTDEYVMLQQDGAALLRVLETGTEPAAAARWYFETYGETVDLTRAT